MVKTRNIIFDFDYMRVAEPCVYSVCDAFALFGSHEKKCFSSYAGSVRHMNKITTTHRSPQFRSRNIHKIKTFAVRTNHNRIFIVGPK